jgi:hypothetical protein
MDREIRCYCCNTYLGVIRDGKLHKKIRFSCWECYDDCFPEPTKSQSSAEDDQVVENLMRMFNIKK